MDPQGNLTVSCGVRAHELKNTIFDVLREQTSINEAIVSVEPPSGSLQFLPANLTLSAAETELSAKPGREFLLKEALQNMEQNFDYILIDCPPTLGRLTINAMVASSGYVTPLGSER